MAVDIAGEPILIELDTTTGSPDIPPDAYLVVHGVVERAPAPLSVSVSNVEPGDEVTFKVGTTVVGTLEADTEGQIFEGVVLLPTLSAGTHTLTAEATDRPPAHATFTVANPPLVAPGERPVDAPPQTVPGAEGRWVLQDVMPGGLGSWVMPANPEQMTKPRVRKVVDGQHTTAIDGQHHLFEAAPMPVDWEFRGRCLNKAMVEKLEAYAALNRRIYVIDHRGDAWTVAITHLEFTPQKRQLVEHAGTAAMTDWAHQYSVRALIYDQIPK